MQPITVWPVFWSGMRFCGPESWSGHKSQDSADFAALEYTFLCSELAFERFSAARLRHDL